MQNNKNWDGNHVFLIAQSSTPGKPIAMALDERTASGLALMIRRIQQTTLAVPAEVAEIADALDYVLVGDPFSRTRHASLGFINSHGYVGDGGPCEAERGGGREARCGRPMQRHALNGGAYPDSPSDADFKRDKESGS